MKFYLHGNHSLKGKRHVLRSMRDRLRNEFNVSVAEVGDQDHWQVLHLGIVAVSPDARYLDGLMKQAVAFLERMHLAEMGECRTELMHVGHDHL